MECFAFARLMLGRPYSSRWLQVGRRHTQHWALQQANQALLVCPYCGNPCRDRSALRSHIRDVCSHLTADFMQPGFVREVSQAALDADPRYAPLHVVRAR
jgi:hypothetical protein